MSGPPLWQRQVGRVVNVVGPPFEALARRDEFAIAVGLVHTARGTVRRGFERQSRRALHLLNLPAGSDVRALSNQVASLERQVRELGKALGDGRAAEEDGAGARQPR